MPPKLRAELAQDPEYRICMRRALLGDHNCQADPLTGKLIEWEHVFIFASNQVQKKWCIIPICWLVHRGGQLNKEINEWIALNRATDAEIAEVSKAVDYKHKKKYLNQKYGTGS